MWFSWSVHLPFLDVGFFSRPFRCRSFRYIHRPAFPARDSVGLRPGCSELGGVQCSSKVPLELNRQAMSNLKNVADFVTLLHLWCLAAVSPPSGNTCHGSCKSSIYRFSRWFSQLQTSISTRFPTDSSLGVPSAVLWHVPGSYWEVQHTAQFQPGREGVLGSSGGFSSHGGSPSHHRFQYQNGLIQINWPCWTLD